jgi:uncharacterized LabA/DUF88 family protein
MRTTVYVDGFNLYFRLLQKRSQLKWLNLKSLAERSLSDANEVTAVRYYTARVSGRLDQSAPARQQTYLDALASIPEPTIHMGAFLASEKFAGLVHPPEFRPRVDMAPPWPDVVKVIKTEEKGSDVNLACHLLLDGFRSTYDVAVVLSNDSDLVEPIRIVTQELGKPVGLLSPVGNPNPHLRNAASFIRRIHLADVAASQFSNPLALPDGTLLSKPLSWV